MKKIIDAELLYMIDAGTPQKDIAVHFRVSEPAISKRLKRIRQTEKRATILDQLTDKEQKFVVAIAEGKTQTDAAATAFDVTTRDSAKSLGYNLANTPKIAEAITAVMEAEGVSRRYLVRKLKNHIDAPDPQVSIRAVDMGFKLHDAYPASKIKNVNLNVEIKDEDISKWFNV